MHRIVGFINYLTYRLLIAWQRNAYPGENSPFRITCINSILTIKFINMYHRKNCYFKKIQVFHSWRYLRLVIGYKKKPVTDQPFSSPHVPPNFTYFSNTSPIEDSAPLSLGNWNSCYLPHKTSAKTTKDYLTKYS